MTEIQKSRRSRGLKSMSAAAVAGASAVGLVLGTGTASAAVDGVTSVVDADGNTITLTLSDTFINGVAPLDGNPLTREWFGDGRASFDVQGPSADDFEGNIVMGYQIGYPMNIGGSVTVEWASPTLGIDIGSGNESSGALALLDPRVDGDGNVLLEPNFIPDPTTSDPDDLIPNPNAGQVIYSPPSVAVDGVGTSTSGLGFHADLLPQATGALELTPGPGIVQSTSAALPINDEVTGSSNEGSGTSGSLQVAGVHGTATGILGNVSVRPYAALTSSTGDVAVVYGAPVRFN